MADATPRTQGYPLRTQPRTGRVVCVLAREFLADALSRGPCVRAKKGTDPVERTQALLWLRRCRGHGPLSLLGLSFLTDPEESREFRLPRSSECSDGEIRIEGPFEPAACQLISGSFHASLLNEISSLLNTPDVESDVPSA